MSRKSAYKQVLSIGTAVVLGFALFTGSLDGAPKLLSPQSDEQAAALAEKQNESPSRTDDEADLVARLESGTASSSDSQNSQDSGDGSDSAATDTGDGASADSAATPIDEVENPDLNRARGVYLSSIPDYAGNPYVALRADSTHPLGTPSFTLDEYDRATEEGCFKKFSKLDSLGRTRKALACVGPESLGQGKRGDISRIHPAGWHQQRYDFIPGQSLYNRCHLIAYCLTAENANKKNLITGTRYMNNEGMLPFEEKTARYIDKTNNHVLYRVTPVFEGSNLVASGVLMEAYSVEDQGKGICFCTYCYNVQPGVAIDYATGDSHLNGKNNQNSHNSSAKEHASAVYILNTNTKKFHKPDCYSVKQMSSKNRKKYKGLRKKLIKDGYSPCKNCNP